MTKTHLMFAFFGLLIVLLVACQSNYNEQSNNSNSISRIKIERFNVIDESLDSLVLSSYIIKQIDSLGKETRSVYYNKEDSIMMQFDNVFTNGNKTRVIWRNRKNAIVRYVNMYYGDDNKIIKSESFNKDSVFIEGYVHKWKNNYKTEEKGPVSDSLFRPNSIYDYTDFDEFESLVEYDLVNDSLYGKFNWKYTKFDSKNQWLEREVYFNNRLTTFEKREIKYQEKY